MMVSLKSLRSTKPFVLNGFYFPDETWASDNKEHSRKVFQLLEISDIADPRTCTVEQGKATYSYPDGKLVQVFSGSVFAYIEEYLTGKGVYSVTPMLVETNATIDIDDETYVVGSVFKKSFEQITPYNKKVKGDLFDLEIRLSPIDSLGYSLAITREHLAPGIGRSIFSADKYRHYQITQQVIVDGVLHDEHTKTTELRYGIRKKKDESQRWA